MPCCYRLFLINSPVVCHNITIRQLLISCMFGGPPGPKKTTSPVRSAIPQNPHVRGAGTTNDGNCCHRCSPVRPRRGLAATTKGKRQCRSLLGNGSGENPLLHKKRRFPGAFFIGLPPREADVFPKLCRPPNKQRAWRDSVPGQRTPRSKGGTGNGLAGRSHKNLDSESNVS
jgi:hypothetical protein